MENTNRIKLIRVSYWIAAILDGIYAINIGLVWLIDDYSGFDPIKMVRFTGGLESRYAWGFACVLVTTWTILLIWADRKPIERRDVILLTAFPVVSGLFVDTIFAITNDLVTWIEILLVQLVYIFLIVLLLSSYVLTRNVEVE
ncbi:MAG: hypothetical protein ACW98D_16665 [Promethearchaeota archaeon]|jgi:predicted neutral ceramidase superfamily lipid hydrolase